MKLFSAILPLLLLSGCATPHPRTLSDAEQEKEREDYRHFFYDEWLPQKPTPEDREDHRYFYSNWLDNR